MGTSVFVSYVLEDESGRRALDRLAAGLPIELLDLSHRAADSEWKGDFQRLVLGAAAVAVLVGERTHESDPIKWEIAVARRMSRPVLGFRLTGSEAPLPDGLAEKDVVPLDSDAAIDRLRALKSSRPPNYLEVVAQAIGSELELSELPDGPVDELLVSYAVLALVAGENVTCEDVHNAWSAWMTRVDPGHPALVPFDQLDSAVAQMDEPYAAAIRRVTRGLERGQ